MSCRFACLKVATPHLYFPRTLSYVVYRIIFRFIGGTFRRGCHYLRIYVRILAGMRVKRNRRVLEYQRLYRKYGNVLRWKVCAPYCRNYWKVILPSSLLFDGFVGHERLFLIFFGIFVPDFFEIFLCPTSAITAPCPRITISSWEYFKIEFMLIFATYVRTRPGTKMIDDLLEMKIFEFSGQNWKYSFILARKSKARSIYLISEIF